MTHRGPFQPLPCWDSVIPAMPALRLSLFLRAQPEPCALAGLDPGVPARGGLAKPSFSACAR